MVELDGSMGEGGGQVLRYALALSAITGTPFRIRQIRARRSKPGLLRQHLTGVRAVAEVCNATVLGDALGSQDLTLHPQAIRPGTYHFAVGTAGSAGLVLQALLPVLACASGPSEVVVQGGTHNPASPPAPFLEHTLFPVLRRMGLGLLFDHEAYGFYPAGGGAYRIAITPGPWLPLRLMERGDIEQIELVAVLSNLESRIGKRELAAARGVLGLAAHVGDVEQVRSPGPGNAVHVTMKTSTVTQVFSSFGSRGARAEDVGRNVAGQALAWRDANVPVGEHLADQLLIYLALAGGTYLTHAPSAHTHHRPRGHRTFRPR